MNEKEVVYQICIKMATNTVYIWANYTISSIVVIILVQTLIILFIQL